MRKDSAMTDSQTYIQSSQTRFKNNYLLNTTGLSNKRQYSTFNKDRNKVFLNSLLKGELYLELSYSINFLINLIIWDKINK